MGGVSGLCSAKARKGANMADKYIESFTTFGSSLAEILSEADNAGSAQVWRELEAKLGAAHDYVLGHDYIDQPEHPGAVGRIVREHLEVARYVSTSAVAEVSKTLSALRLYAHNKWHAVRLRESGKIETAQRCEQAADAIYNELDPSVRW